MSPVFPQPSFIPSAQNNRLLCLLPIKTRSQVIILLHKHAARSMELAQLPKSWMNFYSSDAKTGFSLC